MASRTWKFATNEREHIVTLRHNLLTGRRRVWLDGSLVLDALPLDNFPHAYSFRCGEHRCVVTTGRTFWTLAVDYKFEVDDMVIQASRP